MLTRRSLFACCGYLLLVQATLVLHSDEPAAKLEAEAVQLVKQLGSSSWSKRQNAQHRLNKLGPRALPALRAALRSSDLELRRRAGQLYWDIRLPKRILPPGRRRQVVTQLANGSEISRRKALRVLFRTKKIWLAPMIEQSLAGVAAEEAVQATAWLVPKLAAAKQQALWRKLRPILAKHPQWAQDYHRKQAVLRLTPELAARLWAPKLSQPGRNRYGVDHRFHRLIRSTTHKQRFWSMLLALSRLPGRHRLFLITSLRSVNQVWPKRLGQLLPGLLDEIDRSAATGRWDPEISTALFTLRRHFRNQRGQDWNRRLLRTARLKTIHAKLRTAVVSNLDWASQLSDEQLDWLRTLYRAGLKGKPALRVGKLLARRAAAEDLEAIREVLQDPKRDAKARLASLRALVTRPPGKELPLLIKLYRHYTTTRAEPSRRLLARGLATQVRQLKLELLGLLAREEAEPLVQLEVARELGRRSAAGSGKMLLPLLRSDLHDVVLLAADLARELNRKQAAQLLLERLKGAREARQIGMLLLALGLLRDPKTLPGLTGYLEHEKATVRGAAVEALLAATGHPTQGRGKGLQAIREHLLGGSRLGTRYHLSEAVTSWRASRRTALLLLDSRRLWRLPEPDPQIRTFADGTDPRWMRELVAQGLGLDTVVEVARRYLAGSLQGQAGWLESLFRVCFVGRVAALRQVVLGSAMPHSKHPGYRLVLKMRAAAGDPGPLVTVRGWLADPKQREDALWVYRLRPEQDVLPDLLKLAIDPKRTEDPRPLLLAVLRVVFGDPELPLWQMTAADGRKRARWWYRWWQGQGPDSRRPDWLKSLLKERDKRREALSAIGRLRHIQLLPQVLAMLEDPLLPGQERLEVVRTLGLLGEKRVLPQLRALSAAQRTKGELRVACLAAMVRLGHQTGIRDACQWLEQHRVEMHAYRAAPGSYMDLALALAQAAYRPGVRAMLAWAEDPSLQSDMDAELAALLGRPKPSWERDEVLGGGQPYLFLLFKRWWKVNRQRYREAPSGPRIPLGTLLDRLGRTTGLERLRLIKALSAVKVLPRLPLARLLLSGDAQLRDGLAALLARRRASWALPALRLALMASRALPVSWSDEQQGNNRLRYSRTTKRRLALATLGLAPESQMRRMVGRFKEPLVEALLACGGQNVVRPLVALARNRSHFFHCYLVLRFRQRFAVSPAGSLDWHSATAMKLALAAWQRWAGRYVKPPARQPRDALARMGALPRADRPLTANAAAIVERALTDAEPLVRRRALVVLWASLEPAEHQQWAARAKKTAWIRQALWDVYWISPKSLKAQWLAGGLPAAQRELVRQVSYALDMGHSRAGQRWAAELRRLGPADGDGWRAAAREAQDRKAWRQAAIDWTGALSDRSDHEAYYQRGTCHAKSGDPVKAAADFSRCIALAKTQWQRVRGLAGSGFFNMEAGRWKEAEQDFLRWERKGPYGKRAREWRAVVAWRSRQMPRLLALTQQFAGLERLPTNLQDGQPSWEVRAEVNKLTDIIARAAIPAVVAYRACALIRAGKLDRAEQLLHHLDQFLPASSISYGNDRVRYLRGARAVAWALYHGAKGQREPALRALTEALRYNAVEAEKAWRMKELRRWSDDPAFRKLLPSKRAQKRR